MTRSVGLCSGCAEKNLTSEEANKLFLQVINRQPIFCGSTLIEGAPHIIGLYEKKDEAGYKAAIISTLARVAGNWQQITQIVVPSDAESERIQKGVEIVTIGNGKYLYFLRQPLHYGTGYNGTASIEFLLYSLGENKIIALTFSGRERAGDFWDENSKKVQERPSKIEGEFDNLSDFKDHKDLLKFLESKAAVCDLIYRATANDTDINNVENYAKKWERENPDVYGSMGSGEDWKTITFPYYQENIFTKQVVLPHDSNEEKVENKTYVVATYFGGPVIGYNKNTKQYFVIWIPEGMGRGGSWGIRSYHDPKLTGPSTAIFENDSETIEVDIEKKMFRVHPQQG